jgi:hypothetical protein
MPSPHLRHLAILDPAAGRASINIFHDFYDIYALDCLMLMTYIIYQAVGRTDRTQQKMAALTK